MLAAISKQRICSFAADSFVARFRTASAAEQAYCTSGERLATIVFLVVINFSQPSF